MNWCDLFFVRTRCVCRRRGWESPLSHRLTATSSRQRRRFTSPFSVRRVEMAVPVSKIIIIIIFSCRKSQTCVWHCVDDTKRSFLSFASKHLITFGMCHFRKNMISHYAKFTLHIHRHIPGVVRRRRLNVIKRQIIEYGNDERSNASAMETREACVFI